MKKILITGAGSYIGTSLQEYLATFGDDYAVDVLDMIGEGWKETSFAGYDSVFHVAGIAHADTGKASQETIDLYYRVNTDLAVEAAKKAKADGAKQFIFMSSAIVYGDSAPIGKKKHITKNTAPSPAGFTATASCRRRRGFCPCRTGISMW